LNRPAVYSTTQLTAGIYCVRLLTHHKLCWFPCWTHPWEFFPCCRTLAACWKGL